jgi:hypothetical protein
LPLFMNRQVLVNFAPRDIWALSGTVTSSRSTALSLQKPAADVVPAVPSGVPGVTVVDESEVKVGGTSVGRESPGFVGGRMEVTKTDLVGAGVSSETLMHAVSVKLRSRISLQIFFITGDSTLEILILKGSSRRFGPRSSIFRSNLRDVLLDLFIVVLQKRGHRNHSYRRTNILRRFP